MSLMIHCGSRTPSWGAWIEITALRIRSVGLMVASPRGVRELKLQRLGKGERLSQSHPLVGCV